MGKNKNKNKNKKNQGDKVQSEEVSPKLEEETIQDESDIQNDSSEAVEDTTDLEPTTQDEVNNNHESNGNFTDEIHADDISEPELITHSETNETEQDTTDNLASHRLSVPIQQDHSSSIDYSSAQEFPIEPEQTEPEPLQNKRLSEVGSRTASSRNSVVNENPKVVNLQDIAYEPNTPYITSSTPLLYNNNPNDGNNNSAQYRSIPQQSHRNLLDPDSGAPLLSFARLKSMVRGRSNSYLISTLIVILFIVVSLSVITVLLFQRIFHRDGRHHGPLPLPKYPNPFKFVLKTSQIKYLNTTIQSLTDKSYFSGDKNDQNLIFNLENEFKSFDFNTQLMPYYPYISKAYNVKVEVTDPASLQYTCKSYEPSISEDEGTHEKPEVLAYHPYANFDTIKGRVIYANYGTDEDFKTLLQAGIRVVGRIVLIRQGIIPVGEIISNAYEYGCAAVITYFDPITDGYYKGPLYPLGPYRNQNTISRDTSLNWLVYPGDPLTPGRAAGSSVNRTTPGKSKNIPKILVLPVNVNDATQLFKTLVNKGTKVDKLNKKWKGGLPLSYFTGPSNAHVEMTLEGEGRVKPIWNLLGTIQGIQNPEELVIIGGKRDNLGRGSTHSSVTTSILVEVTRLLDHYQKLGWKPARTIVIASWDGSELGLLGSTEWVEDQYNQVNGSTITYIDIGDIVGSSFKVSSTPSLHQLIRSVIERVPSPNTQGATVFDDFKTAKSDFGDLNEMKDYIPFFYHGGVPSIHLGYDGVDTVHNSHYDTLHNLFKLKDPSLNRTLAISQIATILTIELSTNAVVPLNVTDYGFKLKRDFDKFMKKYHRVAFRNGVDLDSVSQSIQLISDAAEALDYEVKFFYNYFGKITCKTPVCFEVQQLINDRLMGFEKWLMAEKLENLELDPFATTTDDSDEDEVDWYKHGVYRPNGITNAPPTMLREFEQSIIDESWPEAKEWQMKLEKFFENAADSLAFDTGLYEYIQTKS